MYWYHWWFRSCNILHRKAIIIFLVLGPSATSGRKHGTKNFLFMNPGVCRTGEVLKMATLVNVIQNDTTAR